MAPLPQTTIGAVLNASQFSIPLNQRSLAWNFNKLKAVWDDLREATDRDLDHFIGFMVFKESGTANQPCYEVQDGQQRLMCVLSICAILAKTIKEDQTATTQYTYLRQLVMPKGSPRFLLDRHHQDVSRLFVDEAQALQRGRPTAKRFSEAFRELEKEISTVMLAKSLPERDAWVTKFIETIDQRFLVTAVNVTSQSLALKVFHRLNSGGVPLSAADTVKTLFFSAAEQLRIKEGEIISRWDKIADAVPFAELTTFLKYWYLVEMSKRITNTELASGLEPRISADPIATLERMLADAVALQHWWAGEGDVDTDAAEALQLLGCPKLSYPLLWQASGECEAGSIAKKDVDRLARAIVSYFFRELTVRQKKTNDIEDEVAVVSKFVGAADIDGAIAALAAHSPDDEFELAFNTWSTGNKKKQFYVVREIERCLGKSKGASFTWKDDKAKRSWEIEHIVPSSKQVDLKGSVNRIGNLVLLEKSLNRSVRDNDFAKKLQVYKNGKQRKRVDIPPSTMIAVVGPVSDHSITYAPVCDYSEFQDKQIALRQRELAVLGKRIWEIA